MLWNSKIGDKETRSRTKMDSIICFKNFLKKGFKNKLIYYVTEWTVKI